MRSYSFVFRIISLSVLISFAVAAAHAEKIYGITASSSSGPSAGQKLVRFDSASPGTVTVISAANFVTSSPTQVVRSIDFRPATGQLYAISTDVLDPTLGQIYTVNLATGILTAVGTGFSLGNNQSVVVEMEFDPTTDTIRVLTGASKRSGQNNNFRVSPVTGARIAIDPNLDPASAANPNEQDNGVAAAAYSNNTAGAAQTTLYGWDWTGFDTLDTIGGINGSQSPNSGIMAIVSLPATGLTSPSGEGLGMDISPNTGTLFVTHDNPANPNVMGLYTRPLTDPALTPGTPDEVLVGTYPANAPIIVDISVQKASTAAEVSVSGNVLTPTGRGLVRAQVTISDGQGKTQTVSTTRGGTFKFDGIEAGKTYFITVESQQFHYDPQFFQVDDAVSGLRFTPSN